MEADWPALMKVGPSAVSTLASCSARSSAFASSAAGPASQSLSNAPPNPADRTPSSTARASTSSGRRTKKARAASGSYASRGYGRSSPPAATTSRTSSSSSSADRPRPTCSAGCSLP